MAKGQKKSTREIRKPKQDKAKKAAPARSFLEPIEKRSKPAGASPKADG